MPRTIDDTKTLEDLAMEVLFACGAYQEYSWDKDKLRYLLGFQLADAVRLLRKSLLQ